MTARQEFISAARYQEALDLLTELGKCGSCGGSGLYKNRGFKDDNSGPKLIKGKLYNEEVCCRKCDGHGLDPRARSLLLRAGRKL